VSSESPYESRARSAVKALYDWVGEREQIAEETEQLFGFTKLSCIREARIIAFREVIQQMRTLFAGLIEFEQTEEKQKNGL